MLKTMEQCKQGRSKSDGVLFTWSASCQLLELMRSARASVKVHAHALASARASSRFLTFLRGVLDAFESGPADIPGNSPAFQCRFSCGGRGGAGQRPSPVPGNPPPSSASCLAPGAADRRPYRQWPPGTPPPSSVASVPGAGRSPKCRAFPAAGRRGASPATGSRGSRTDRRPTSPQGATGDEAVAAAFGGWRREQTPGKGRTCRPPGP